jgi:hypothetical protein
VAKGQEMPDMTVARAARHAVSDAAGSLSFGRQRR